MQGHRLSHSRTFTSILVQHIVAALGEGTFAMDWIEVNGTSLRYDITGTGPSTLVLVHEMGGTLDSWEPTLGVLSNGRLIVRYDTRGAGLSEKIRQPVTWDVMVADLTALLDALGI